MSILLYNVSILLHNVPSLQYNVSILLYNMTILLYNMSILLDKLSRFTYNFQRYVLGREIKKKRTQQTEHNKKTQRGNQQGNNICDMILGRNQLIISKQMLWPTKRIHLRQDPRQQTTNNLQKSRFKQNNNS